ncbi:HAD-IIIA family hydrolase [Pelistega sp. NLN82]|uniref:phosphoglycolate phosphatase n=1 Tax=Pelistega ratti TaxID=2652177 RepID=A0A6L9Y574_9BURK|nr:HAD-IIIA family hydrolase [Pelistega ratti]NEN75610.1 HAD-IIIA family hydrolase [Pelistega ratti]
MKFSLVVFDWDGTLMDSTHSIVVAIQNTCRDLGWTVPTDEQASWVIGLSLTEALKRAIPDLQDDQVNIFIDRYKYHYLLRDPDLRLFPGNMAILDELKAKGVMMAVATGKSRVGLNRALANHQLNPYFDATRTGEETASKPNPLMLNEIMDELNIPASEVVMVGDTTHDIELAKNAGVQSIAVTYGAHSKVELERAKPDFLVENVSALHRLLSVYC